MGKASKKKRQQQESQDESMLNGKSLIARDISSKGSLFNKPIVHFFLIAIVGFLVYSNTFSVPFHFDDMPNIVANYKLKNLDSLWPPSGSRWFGFLTFALNYYFGGLNTIGYHIVNLAIHIMNAILVYLLVVLTFKTPFFSSQSPQATRRGEQSAVSNRQSAKTSFDLSIHPFTQFRDESLTGLTYLPLFIALIFVSHPIQTQAVTYIVQRFTSLAVFFYLFSLVMYIKTRLSQPAEAEVKAKFFSASTVTFYIFSLISAVLAMKTKEIAFTLPIIIVLYEFMFFEGKVKKRILYLIPILLTMLIIPLSLIGIDKPIGDAIGELRETAQETEQISRLSYLFTQFRVIVTYIRLLVLPINQNLDYDYPIYHSFLNPEVFLSLLFLLLIFTFGVYLSYSKRYKLYASRFLAFGIFWFFITLSVESSIIPIRDIIFEHRMYLPSVGAVIAFSIVIFYVLHFVIQRSRISTSYFPLPTSYFLLLSTVVITLSGATYIRNIVWKDEISLWEDAANKSPEKVRVYYNLGKIYSDKGWTDKAIENYQIALRFKPDYIEAHTSLGLEYKNIGWIDKAIEHYQIAIWLGPDFQIAHNNIGNAYIAKGWIDKAIEHYRFALRLKPDFIEAHNNLGMAYERKGLLEEAIKQYQTALIIDPEFKVVRENLNKLLRIKGK